MIKNEDATELFLDTVNAFTVKLTILIEFVYLFLN